MESSILFRSKMITGFYYNSINNNPVHEHNHTRILVPEVLCSLVGPETQNCSYPIPSNPG